MAKVIAALIDRGPGGGTPSSRIGPDEPAFARDFGPFARETALSARVFDLFPRVFDPNSTPALRKKWRKPAKNEAKAPK
jgi:hypothetical protein